MLLSIFLPKQVLKTLNRVAGVTHFTRNMCSNAYFRWKEEWSVFNFSFHLDHKELGVSRNFNFSRQVTETIGDFQKRVQTNVDKTLSKKKKKKKSQQAGSDTDTSEIAIVFSVNGKNIDTDAICKDVLYKGGVTMKLFTNEFHINVNAPWVSLLSLPDSMLAEFPTYPSKVELEFADKNDCIFTWYRSTVCSSGPTKQKSLENLEWVEVGQGFYYTPSSADIGCYIKLKCTPMCKGFEGPSIEAISASIVQAGPGMCPFDIRHAFTQEYLDTESFRVVSYNILADLYADSDYSREVLYPYCPPYAIALDYRKQLILKELMGYHSDIICLQEVDNKLFDLDLSPVLGSLGYQGVFSKKGGQVTEGLACFFRACRFELLSSQNITLGEEIPTNPLFERFNNAVNQNEALKARVLDRGTILKVVVLQHKDTGSVLVVGITHLYFHPDADHVRLLQAGACLGYLQHTIKEWQQKCDNKVALLFCGDFNSTPEFGVYHLLTQKFIPTDHADWSSNEQEAVQGLELSHDLHMESACGTPKYTNFTSGFADCLDYIFYQTDKLKVKQVIPMPSEEELQQYTALPSVVMPSDHVAIIADLAWST